MLDFKELPDDGIQFEQLVREILLRNHFEVHWTGVGPDGGRDLIAIEKAEGSLAPFERKWLVSCKHKAHSGNSVGINDISDLPGACAAVGADGFLLATSTQPSSSVVTRFKEIETQGELTICYWDAIEIEKRLRTPMTLPLVHLFMPESSKKIGWTIFNTYSPSLWAANYKDYFVYLSSRTAHSFPDLEDAENIIRRLEEVTLPEGEDWEEHYLRPRSIFYDNKHDTYSVSIDYLFPHGKEGDTIKSDDLEAMLKDGQGLYSDEESMWNLTFWEIKYIPSTQISDHFHLDHADYYEPYVGKFNAGLGRTP